MQSIGEKLEEARKRQGVSIREAAEATKIRADFLIDFENNRFDQDLPEIYKRGFLKIYAKLLKLDVDKLLADYHAQQLGHSQFSRKDRDSLGRVQVEGYQSHHMSEEVVEEPKVMPLDKSIYWKIGIVVMLLFMVFGLVTLFISIFSSDSVERSAPYSESTIAAESVSEPLKPREIVLVATGDCTVLVRDASDKQKVFFRGSLSVGQREHFTSNGPVEITSTEVQNIEVRIDGRTQRSRNTGLGKFYIE